MKPEDLRLRAADLLDRLPSVLIDDRGECGIHSPYPLGRIGFCEFGFAILEPSSGGLLAVKCAAFSMKDFAATPDRQCA
ncbi:MAG: hypothetical protein AB7P20_04400 [Rhizobiaceae bacterium]